MHRTLHLPLCKVSSMIITPIFSGDGYCLPVFVVCNSVLDCPGHEDEQDCDSYTCPGYYRCHASPVCLHPDHVCDGYLHCPRYDDELLCDFSCPVTCTCHGHAFFCPRPVQLHKFSQLRYLDASGSGMSPDDVSQNSLLVYLSLANCGLSTLNTLAMSNLQHLDLSDNLLASVTHQDLLQLPNLIHLRLSGNPIRSLFPDVSVRQDSAHSLRTLDLSRVVINTVYLDTFQMLSNLHELNLSDSKTVVLSKSRLQLSHVDGLSINSAKSQNSSLAWEGKLLSLMSLKSESQFLAALRVLDLRGCPVRQIPSDAFSGLKDLQHMYADSYRLCCGNLFNPDFNINECKAPEDLISTCQFLLGPNYIRIFVPAASCLSVLGNVFLFIRRVVFRRWRVQSGLDVYMSHITVCDFGMGVYLAVISTAHWVHQGHYAQTDITWRHSGLCQMTGLVYCTVNTVSVLLVFLASGHGVITTRFPRAVTGHRPLTSQAVCGLAWVTGLTVAIIPLLVPHWKFYSHSSICLPILNDTSASQDAGHDFAFALTVLIFTTSVLSGVGQGTMHTLTHSQILNGAGWVVPNDVLIIKRSYLIFSKCILCWILAGIVVFVKWHGLTHTNIVEVGTFLVLLPLSSSANCFLYVLSTYREQRQQKRRARLMVYLKAKSKQVRICRRLIENC